MNSVNCLGIDIVLFIDREPRPDYIVITGYNEDNSVVGRPFIVYLASFINRAEKVLPCSFILIGFTSIGYISSKYYEIDLLEVPSRLRKNWDSCRFAVANLSFQLAVKVSVPV